MTQILTKVICDAQQIASIEVRMRNLLDSIQLSGVEDNDKALFKAALVSAIEECDRMLGVLQSSELPEPTGVYVKDTNILLGIVQTYDEYRDLLQSIGLKADAVYISGHDDFSDQWASRWFRNYAMRLIQR